ncbi:sensor histidine kinase [Plebeiibacterium marinum]|uniref:histidine kinase n=1 Tax=Plebeiibacterium marinum TaxID=2992111 RepID=A0AAE3MBS0_9BACT|nr:ATP-binding protein [Plebeiobacterium marinum]MCW3804963.1 ATP-binding protein [Plebeiobacterium marinum]
MEALQELQELRDKIVNKAIVVGYSFGMLSYVITFIRALEYGFNWAFACISLVVLYLGILTFYRKRINLNLKIFSIAIVILAALVTGLSHFGYMVSSKAYIILIPIFLSFVIGYRKAFVMLLVFSGCYMFFGILYMSKVLPLNVDANVYALSPVAWGMDISIISLTALALLIVGRLYSDTIVNNLSTIKSKNEELESKQRKYQLLFENSIDAIVLLRDGVVVDVNSSAQEMFKAKTDELVGKRIVDFLPELQSDGSDSEDLMAYVTDQLSKKKVVSFEMQHKRMDGTLFDADVKIAVLQIEDGFHYQAVLKDVTHRKKQQKEIGKYREHLERLVEDRTSELNTVNEKLQNSNNELTEQHKKLRKSYADLKSMQKKLIEAEKMASIGLLTAGVAHEINNPLNFIQTGLYSLQNQVDSSSPDSVFEKNQEVLGYMEEGVRRISNIVNSLGSFNSNASVKFKKSDVVEVVNNCLTVLNHKIIDRIQVVKNFTEEKIWVYGDENGLHQVFINVLHNAVQAIKNDGQIGVDIEVKNDKVIVYIKDNGIGMSKHTVSKMFDPFYTKKTLGEGTGLGMTIVYNVIKEHRGSINVDSKLGEGTQVKIQLPIYNI